MSTWVYHLKKCEENWGSPCWLRSGRPKCKLPSKLRKIIQDTKRYVVKGMNLSGHSNILGNIVNALEMILNNQRAVNFICQCFQGKNWPIPYLAVWGIMVIRYGVKAMNLSAHSNILGNIIIALEMILNHRRAIHFI